MPLPRASKAAPQASKLPGALRIGITGHRRDRLKLPDHTLMHRIAGVIELLRRASRLPSARQIEIVSALAEGVDEIAARTGLTAHCRLTAVIPFKPKDYEATFSDKAYRAVFRELLRMADRRIVLPGSLKDTKAGYVAVGAETLDRSDVVLTVWDGAPARGRGGTQEVLQAALQRRLPIIWIDATEDRAPRLLQRSPFGPCPRLESLARRAQPAQISVIRECVPLVAAA